LATIWVFSRFYDPKFPQIIIVLFKVDPFCIWLITSVNMKSHRKSQPWVSTFSGIKVLKINEECLFVTQMMILRKLVIDLKIFSFYGKGRFIIYRKFVHCSVLSPRTPNEVHSLCKWGFFKHLTHLDSLFNDWSYKKRVVSFFTKELEIVAFFRVWRDESHIIFKVKNAVKFLK